MKRVTLREEIEDKPQPSKANHRFNLMVHRETDRLDPEYSYFACQDVRVYSIGEFEVARAYVYREGAHPRGNVVAHYAKPFHFLAHAKKPASAAFETVAAFEEDLWRKLKS